MRRGQQQGFQLGNAFLADVGFSRHIRQLFAVVESEHAQLRPLLFAGSDPVQMVKPRIAIRTFHFLFALQVVIQFLLGRHRRRTAVTRNHQCAAGISIAAGLIPTFIVQVTAQQTGHKGIARTQYVQYLNSYAGVQFDLLPACRDLRFKYRTALGAAFANQRGPGRLAHVFQRGQGIGAAASNMKLFFGADDQIKVM
ncbi:hypothetical protein D3C72_1358750 [compost metagenome]